VRGVILELTGGMKNVIKGEADHALSAAAEGAEEE
jgi:hypothetical protein